jgi:hypothetical protein
MIEVSGEVHILAALPPQGVCPWCYWIGDWMGSRADMDAVVKRENHFIAPARN